MDTDQLVAYLKDWSQLRDKKLNFFIIEYL